MFYNSHQETASLYIHWPFCPYKCHFCPFVALASHDQFMPEYHASLKKEIISYAQACPAQIPLQTIYFGGGTPSTYPFELLLDMSDTLKTMFCFQENTEITLEVNPGTVKEESFAVWKAAGINRLSIGVQGLKDRALQSLNRQQKREDVEWLLKRAPTFFENISIDLIIGLPGVSVQEWHDLIATVVTWPITHLSIYFLTVHENTPLYFKVQKKQVELAPDEHMVNTYHATVDFLAQHGFERYELSSFAKKGFQSRHNTVYWERKPFKGFGIGAWSFDGQRRLQNEKNIMHYIAAMRDDKNIVTYSEDLTPKNIYLERLMLGLRRSCGVHFNALAQELDHEQQNQLKLRIATLVENGFLSECNNILMLTAQGLMVENEVITQLWLDT